MVDQKISLSIVICNYNTADFLERCLERLTSQPFKYSNEIIVVDNASTDGSAQMVRNKFPQVKLIANGTNRWMTGGYNDGMKDCQGQWICLLEPDTMIESISIEKMISFLNENKSYGAVSCKTFLGNGNLIRTCSTDYPLSLAFLSYTFLGKLFTRVKEKMFEDLLYRDWDRSSSREVEVVYAHCIVLRREVLEMVGDFDERFRLYYSEIDLCRRMRKKNWKVGHVAEATIIHYERQSVERAGIQKIATVYQEDICRYYRKYYGAFISLILSLLIQLTNLFLSIRSFKSDRIMSRFLMDRSSKDKANV